MKKVFYLTLLFFMVMGMSGCGGGGVNLEDGGEGPVDATSSGNVRLWRGGCEP
jgi:hypothetical protein